MGNKIGSAQFMKLKQEGIFRMVDISVLSAALTSVHGFNP